jgi:hypothetical protein
MDPDTRKYFAAAFIVVCLMILALKGTSVSVDQLAQTLVGVLYLLLGHGAGAAGKAAAVANVQAAAQTTNDAAATSQAALIAHNEALVATVTKQAAAAN